MLPRRPLTLAACAIHPLPVERMGSSDRVRHDLAVRGKIGKQESNDEPASHCSRTLSGKARAGESWPDSRSKSRCRPIDRE